MAMRNSIAPREFAKLCAAERMLRDWAIDVDNGEIFRDESDGKTYWRDTVSGDTGDYARDRETIALRKVAEICERNNLHYYHHADCRDCALYVATFPLNKKNYRRGIACVL